MIILKYVSGVICIYRIGMFSKITRVSIKTLRYYDEAGLLKPAFVDEENGYRYYTSDQLPKVHDIIALRQIGFSIEEISTIFQGSNISSIFEDRKCELTSVLKETQEQLLKIDNYIEQMNGQFSFNLQAAIKELPEVIVYSKRMVVPGYDSYFEVVPSIGREILQANPGLKCPEAFYCFTIYHDCDYREKDIDAEFCEAVTTWGKDTETIKFKKMERVPQAACVYHKGPYTNIGKTYSYLFKWISDNGYKQIGPPRESVIDGIWNKDDENDWLTELQVPVERK